MCGIAGFLETEHRGDAALSRALVLEMAQAIAHRGPDAQSAFIDADAGIAFGHRRLSIIDLSDAGAQPIRSADGRWILIYNGEIYNYEELRALLQQRAGTIAWRGHSDGEVLTEAIARLGFEAALRQTNGMFAVAAWDMRERMLFLARDRMGEKPLYYGWQGSTFLFCSELKALARHPSFERRINPTAVSQYVAYGYVPSPLSIYEGIAQLEPGHYVALKAGVEAGSVVRRVPYWQLPEPAPQNIAESRAIEELESLLSDAIRIRMRADVPTGAFLSGGVDSSLIVALMQAQSANRIQSFSIGFGEREYDESRYAAAVAAHVGTQHTSMHVAANDALETIPLLARLYDEPFADDSQIPTYLLSKLTRTHVKVALSGDAGDELFAGYGRYSYVEDKWTRRVRALDMLRPPLATLFLQTPAALWRAMSRTLPRSLGKRLQPWRVRRIGQLLASRNRQQLYELHLQAWTARMLDRPKACYGASSLGIDIDAFADPFLGMTYLDLRSYLPDDILVKVDRASMAASLEARVPMLDHRVVEFSARLPLELKQRDGRGKWILRQILGRHVPAALVERPKHGFSVPTDAWLRGRLRAWADELLTDQSTVIAELVDMKTVREAWRQHQKGDLNEGSRLWVILMLIAWAREWRPI